MPEYEVLRFIWWLLLGILLIGFAITDGFDLGVAAIFRFVGRSNEERTGVARIRRARLGGIRYGWCSARVLHSLPGRCSTPRHSPVFTWRCCCCSQVLIIRPVGFTFRGKDRRSALARMYGTGRCASMDLLPHCCLESRLAICSSAYPSTSTSSRARFTAAGLSLSCIPSPCCRESSASRCSSCTEQATRP